MFSSKVTILQDSTEPCDRKPEGPKGPSLNRQPEASQGESDAT